ncbi:hypothetical protein BASA60_011433 [Batrachochytrium salamandrivorans]|nr:hypothetical protein BASA60_011433 [Batrachochytrium salamandrivorans]KAH9267347.1 hypothetical protein BASA84_000682 [Batrachochytrium salamandrivorans]
MASVDSISLIDPWVRIDKIMTSVCIQHVTEKNTSVVALIGPSGIGSPSLCHLQIPSSFFSLGQSKALGIRFIRLDLTSAMLEAPQDIHRWILVKFHQALLAPTGAAVIIKDFPAWVPAKDARLEFFGAICMGAHLLRESTKPVALFVEAESVSAMASVHQSALEMVHETIVFTKPKYTKTTPEGLFYQEFAAMGVQATLSDGVVLPPDICHSFSRSWKMVLAQRTIGAAAKRTGLLGCLASPHKQDDSILVLQEDVDKALQSMGAGKMLGRQGLNSQKSVSWSDIGGYEDVKARLDESVVWFYKNPAAFQRLGIRPPRGVLLYGPPGTGKTLIAHAVAKDSGSDFIVLSLPELVHGHVGDSEKALAGAFREARKRAPCVMFLDEIDALFQKRDSGGDLNTKLVAQIAIELDSMAWNDSSVVFLAATNHAEIMDPVLVRSGRFDRLIFVGAPSYSDRLAILQLLTKEITIDSTVDLAAIAKVTEGKTGAYLRELVQYAWQFATVGPAIPVSDNLCLGQEHLIRALKALSADVKGGQDSTSMD